MKKIMFVLVLLSFSSVLLYTQDSSQLKSNALSDKKWALQFGIANNFNLTNFQSGEVSFKKTLSPDKAIRLGIAIGGTFTGSDQHGQNSPNDTNHVKQSTDWNNQNIGINAQYVWYPNPSEDILLFYGFGPSVSFGWNKTTNENDYRTPPQEFINIDEAYSWGLGINAVLGVEWFASRTISLSAEYRGGAMYTWQKNKSTRQVSTDPFLQWSESTQHGLSWITSTVRFGVSAYFNL